jgi:signal transduction histidine kinase
MTSIKAQVFSNLMGNAVKFARPAGNRLTARKYPPEEIRRIPANLACADRARNAIAACLTLPIPGEDARTLTREAGLLGPS